MTTHLIYWLLIGVTLVVAMGYYIHRVEDEDLTYGDVLMLVIMSFLGPLGIIFGLIMYFRDYDWLSRVAIKKRG